LITCLTGCDVIYSGTIIDISEELAPSVQYTLKNFTRVLYIRYLLVLCNHKIWDQRKM